MAAAQAIDTLFPAWLPAGAPPRSHWTPCFQDRRGRFVLGTPAPEPCPFCGTADDVILVHAGHGDVSMFNVVCESCDADGPLASTRREAARLWNQRGVTPESRLHRLLFGPGEA